MFAGEVNPFDGDRKLCPRSCADSHVGHHGKGLEVASCQRLETSTAEVFGNVLGGFHVPGRASSAPFELGGGKEADMVVQALSRWREDVGGYAQSGPQYHCPRHREEAPKAVALHWAPVSHEVVQK